MKLFGQAIVNVVCCLCCATAQRIRLAQVTSGLTLLDYDQGTIRYTITCVATDGYLATEVSCLFLVFYAYGLC